MHEHTHNLTRRDALKTGALLTGSLVVGGTALTSSAAAGIGDGRVAHYTMNTLYGKGREKDGLHDASPYGNHGHWMTATDPIVGGRVGNALAFDGVGDYVVVNHDASLNVTTATAATWLKIDDTARYHFFLGKRGGGDNEYQMYYRGADFGTPTMAFWNGSTIYDGSLSLDTETWHHLAWVIDDDGFRGYHNGTEVLTIEEAAMPPGSGGAPLYIGFDSVGNYAEGMVDEVRLYNRALEPWEIQNLVAMGGE